MHLIYKEIKGILILLKKCRDKAEVVEDHQEPRAEAAASEALAEVAQPLPLLTLATDPVTPTLSSQCTLREASLPCSLQEACLVELDLQSSPEWLSEEEAKSVTRWSDR